MRNSLMKKENKPEKFDDLQFEGRAVGTFFNDFGNSKKKRNVFTKKEHRGRRDKMFFFSVVEKFSDRFLSHDV